jgi:hypothetical protein
MNPDEFEKQLYSRPMRQIPDEWRQEILSAARQARLPEHAPPVLRSSTAEGGRTTHHVSLLSTLIHQLSALLWPHPAAWAGLAAVWVVILGINLTTREATPLVAKRGSARSPQVFMAFQEQERLLSELLGPLETPVAERPKTRLPQPRSERRREMLLAQSGLATTELRGAFGVREACSRFWADAAYGQRQQAGRTPNAPRCSLPTATIAAREQSEPCGA